MHTWVKCVLMTGVGMLAACDLARNDSSIETGGKPTVSKDTLQPGAPQREEALSTSTPVADVSEICDVNSKKEKFCEITINGEIDPGLLSALSKQVMDITISGGRVRTVVIISPGGDVKEALQIGRYVRRLEFNVRAFDCYSSCVLVLAGGVKRFVLGPLGIHRPYFASGATTTELARAEFSKLRNEVTQFFQEGGVSPKLWDDMLLVPPENMRLLSSLDQKAYGISGTDPSYMEKEAREKMRDYGIDRTELNRRLVEKETICNEMHPDPNDIFNRVTCKANYEKTGNAAD